MKLSAKAYIADELANKVFYLQKALEQSRLIIKTLEEENARLQVVLNELMQASCVSGNGETKLMESPS